MVNFITYIPLSKPISALIISTCNCYLRCSWRLVCEEEITPQAWVEGSSLSQLLCLAGMMCWRRRHVLNSSLVNIFLVIFLMDLLMPIGVALQKYL